MQAVYGAAATEAVAEFLGRGRETGVVAAAVVLEEALSEDRRELKPSLRIHISSCTNTSIAQLSNCDSNPPWLCRLQGREGGRRRRREANKKAGGRGGAPFIELGKQKDT